MEASGREIVFLGGDLILLYQAEGSVLEPECVVSKFGRTADEKEISQRTRWLPDAGREDSQALAARSWRPNPCWLGNVLPQMVCSRVTTSADD